MFKKTLYMILCVLRDFVEMRPALDFGSDKVVSDRRLGRRIARLGYY